MAGNLITSLLSLATNLLPSIRASVLAPSSSSNSSNSENERSRAVEEDLERLMRTLERIKATLYDAEEREIVDRSVKLWLKELKKVAYDAEDVLSEYRYEVTRVQVEARKAFPASVSHKRNQIEYIAPIPNGMVERLDKIRSRFDEIAKDREALQLRESDGMRHPNNIISRIPMGHMVDEASIFGRGAEMEKVIDFLLSEKEKDKSFSVISIVGKGGLGKTTIAQLVYKNCQVSQYFDLFGWVCVSEEFDVRRLIKSTIESISSKSNYGASELSPLQEELAEIVKGRKILLVLDDVWNEIQSLWESFRVSFKEAKMVKIIVTTRNKKVAEVMQMTTCLSPTNLPEDSCWQLFQHYAFSGTSDTVPTHLVEMGREIMRKCGGLPLAVKSIASLLRYELDEEGWREILESDLWESKPSNDIFPALQISYAHLPSHLKSCFLFCSTYPKDYLLHKMNLIELWISHGYIESRGKRRITETGVEYYEELQKRSFLDEFSNYKTECCKLHDIIHDLARLNSENEHYSVEINHPLDIQEGNIPREAYHLYVGGFLEYVDKILPQNMSGLRTLSMDMRECDRDLENNAEIVNLNSEMSEYNEECSENIAICNLTKFKLLRVLEFKVNFTKIPNFISELKHLVYLCITSSRLKMLPSSIGLLYNLQTLILDCSHLVYLPESIGDLANLLRLFINSYFLKEFPLCLKNLYNLHGLSISSRWFQALPDAIGCFSSLEELYLLPPLSSEGNNNKLDFVPHGLVNFPAIKAMVAWFRVRTIAWLKDMKDLEGKLSIEGLDNMSNLVDAQRANLRNKCKLETLDLCWYSGCYVLAHNVKSQLILSLVPEACEGMLVGPDDADFYLLECLQPPPNLKKLRVRYYYSATMPAWMGDPFSLQSINAIKLVKCHNLQSLPFSNLHTLKHLKIEACGSIRVLQLEQLPSQLVKLKISCCDHLQLITGLGNLDMLVSLGILSCRALKSLTMDELQLVESSEPFGDFSHEKPHIGCQRISSLNWLKIELCCLLRALPDGLIPSRPCYVHVSDCGFPDIKIGYLQ